MAEKLAALRAARDGSGRSHITDFIANKGPKCPHCGEEIDINDHELWHLYDDNDQDIECPLCGEDFHVQIHVSYSYSTEDQPDEDDEDNETEASDGEPEVPAYLSPEACKQFLDARGVVGKDTHTSPPPATDGGEA